MPGMTEDDKELIDIKLKNQKNEIMNELVEKQTPFNIKIGEIHQEIMGYGGRPGISKRLEVQECRQDELESRIKIMESNNNGKIETRKAVFGMIGSGGFVGLLVWLSQFFGGGKTP